jgi:hypothetical protein
LSRLARLAAATALLTLSFTVPFPHLATAAEATLTLLDQPYAIARNDAWTASFQVTGDLGASIAAATASTAIPPTATPPTTPARPLVQARVQAHRPVADRAELRAAMTGEMPPVVSRLTVPFTAAGAGGSAISMTVPTTGDPDVGGSLVLARAGVYPITVELLVDGSPVAAHRTFLERLPVVPTEGDPPLQIAVVARLDDPGPQPDAATRAAAGAALDEITTAAEVLDGSLSVQLPPSVVRELDDATLAQLDAALRGTEVLAVPALALDPSSAVAAGRGDAFSRQLRDGEDLVARLLPEAAPRRSAWLVSTPLSAPAAALLRQPLGYDLLVFDPDVYNGLEGGIGAFHDPTLSFTVDLGGETLPGLLVHPISRLLQPAERTAAGLSATDAAVAILAELRVTRAELGTQFRRAAVLATPPGAPPDPEVLQVLARYATQTPETRLATLAELTVTDVMDVPERGPEVVRLPVSAGIDLAERVRRIDLTRLNATGAGSMLADPSRAAAWDDELDELVSTALDDATVNARLDAISAEVQGVYACVQTPDPSSFTLTGRSQTLRLTLTNACDEELRVVVHPTSSKLRFPAGDVEQTLAPNSVNEVPIEIEARTNGTSAMGVELLTPVGSLRLPQTLVLTARVNALSGLGQVVTGGALLVLVSWWYQHFRRRRRVRRALLGEVDNPTVSTEVSPDAAEVASTAPSATVSTVAGPPRADASEPSDSVSEP